MQRFEQTVAQTVVGRFLAENTRAHPTLGGAVFFFSVVAPSSFCLRQHPAYGGKFRSADIFTGTQERTLPAASNGIPPTYSLYSAHKGSSPAANPIRGKPNAGSCPPGIFKSFSGPCMKAVAVSFSHEEGMLSSLRIFLVYRVEGVRSNMLPIFLRRAVFKAIIARLENV
jgi:hypothetical protein